MRYFTMVASSALCLCLAAPVVADQAAEAKKAYELAETLRKSALNDDDLRRALEIQQGLYENGSGKSLLRIAQLQLKLGEPDNALTSFNAAADSGSGYARFLLAVHHAKGDFGAASDQGKGLATLKEMAAGAGDARAVQALADLYEDGVGGTPADAFNLYAELAKTGHPRGLWKHGVYLLDGTAVPVDAAQAAVSLQQSAEAGYDRAWLDLAKAHMATRNFQAARASLDRAVELDVRKAEAERALAHYNGALGGYSDADMGRKGLISLAEQGNTSAASIVLRNHERRATRMREADLNAIVAALEIQMEDGSRHAAAVLARAFVRLRPFVANADGRHAALVRDHLDKLPNDKRMAEKVSATYNPRKHLTSTREIATMLEPTSGEAFVQAAMRLRGFEKTSFVYLVQKELAALDAYNGRPSGKLTSATIQAIFNYCRTHGIFETCKHGPVTYDSSLLVARAIGAEKQMRLTSAASN